MVRPWRMLDCRSGMDLILPSLHHTSHVDALVLREQVVTLQSVRVILSRLPAPTGRPDHLRDRLSWLHSGPRVLEQWLFQHNISGERFESVYR